ncbi:FAD-binding oxidoreductase [Acuticoccus sp. I52.16.1]|uniref:FAD-binding oxidoreductase n=1 Tax=Acuticoccus sp. I52.16.1 TaxID=2928472 RepID=UPI001FCFC94A|nr:FAD-binding oxidoreductase [Acuticoccus sp. I52.16.1]UOM32928.1 FAD-binding oxidoreductase [Acuticoccus sp. I52.16.1]
MGEELIGRLIARLGEAQVRVGADIPPNNCVDASNLTPVTPKALLLPRTTEEVAAALALCNEAGQPVVTQGGMTGLAAGAQPGEGEVAISLQRMRGIEEIDPVAGTLTVLAGTPLAEVQAAAEEAGFFCGIDLGARGTATIGGNVATNAGGNQVVRYGMTRRNVLGLEAVQADGTVLTSLNKMMKNNTGYDWTQLFIGSEGTLGIVTRVVLGLHPKPPAVETALVAAPSAEAMLTLLARIQSRFGHDLLTFEAMWREFMDVAIDGLKLAQPFAERHEVTLLIELGCPDADRVTEALGEWMEEGLVADALIAQSGADAQRMWAFRESVYEYGHFHKNRVNLDISLPRGSIGPAVAALREVAAARWPQAIHVIFGHVADSNLHVVVGPLDGGTGSVTAEEKHTVDEGVYEVVRRFQGSVSAEHGIGRLKRPYLGYSRTPAELKLMHTLKAALDPKGILNPGRVLDPA